MRLKVIACDVLFREVSHWAARSPHTIDLAFLQRSLHDEPDDLRAAVQAEIDGADECDAIVLGYGLCSNAAAYLSVRSVPVVLPRAHDCITLFLGSRERYRESFDGHPGTYYYTSGWIERAGTRVERTTLASDEAYDRILQDYIARFGEDNARYLMDTLHTWWKSYTRAAFIEMRLPDAERFEVAARELARRVAQEYNWSFEQVRGDDGLFRLLLFGDWAPEQFLIAPPSTQIVPSYEEDVVAAATEHLQVPPRAPRLRRG